LPGEGTGAGLLQEIEEILNDFPFPSSRQSAMMLKIVVRNDVSPWPFQVLSF
jgi:hypothetical protein